MTILQRRCCCSSSSIRSVTSRSFCRPSRTWTRVGTGSSFLRELLIALVALVAFLFAGPYVLDLMRVSEPSLTVAGGVILFLIALRMVFPSALAVLLLITNQDPVRRLEWLLAVALAWLISATILHMASGLRRLLGDRGLVALERPMGMVLVAAAVQMVMTGVSGFVAGL